MKDTYVYIGMCVDILHSGHINIISEANKFGKVIVGLLTDNAIELYKPSPYLKYEDRFKVISMIKGVELVIPQTGLDYTENLLQYKPAYVLHGDDWKKGVLEEYREQVIELLSSWGGQVIDVPYTEGISSTLIKKELKKRLLIPYFRVKTLKEILEKQEHLLCLEAHNAISARIVDEARVEYEDGSNSEFNCLWFSSLTDSAARGKPDEEVVDLTSKILTLREMLDQSTKPIIVDADSGGTLSQLTYSVRELEKIGVSAICIEDKKGEKRNSLFGKKGGQQQENLEVFSQKIRAATKARASSEFLIIARVESLILEKGIDDAIKRAEAYVKAGADMILIHSISSDGREVLEFCNFFSKQHRIPLIVVPTKYNQLYQNELFESGARIIIYANHLLRASYYAMREVAKSILQSGRSLESENMCLPISEIFTPPNCSLQEVTF